MLSYIIIELALLWINQVYYFRYKCKRHKYYNNLQSIFNCELFTKDIKMPNGKAWVC
jgi:hypothetical protein